MRAGSLKTPSRPRPLPTSPAARWSSPANCTTSFQVGEAPSRVVRGPDALDTAGLSEILASFLIWPKSGSGTGIRRKNPQITFYANDQSTRPQATQAQEEPIQVSCAGKVPSKAGRLSAGSHDDAEKAELGPS